METASRASCIQRCLLFCLYLASSARKDGGLCWHTGPRAQPHLAGAIMLVQCGIGPSSFMRGVLSCPVCDSFCWLRLRCGRRSLVCRGGPEKRGWRQRTRRRMPLLGLEEEMEREKEGSTIIRRNVRTAKLVWPWDCEYQS